MACQAVSDPVSMFKSFVPNVHSFVVCIAGSDDADIEDLTMNNLVFISGTEPLGAGSQMCLNFSIIDDQLVEPTERFTVCGRSSQNAVVILNNGCTDIKIRDNDGIYTIDCLSYVLNPDFNLYSFNFSNLP